jgi:hypothetical protein
MCINGEGEGQTATKHVKTVPSNVCSRTVPEFEFHSDHSQHQTGETLFNFVHTLTEEELPDSDLPIFHPCPSDRQPYNSLQNRYFDVSFGIFILLANVRFLTPEPTFCLFCVCVLFPWKI